MNPKRKSCRIFGLELKYFWFIVFLPLSLLFPFSTPISLCCQKQLVCPSRTVLRSKKGKHDPRQILWTWHARKAFYLFVSPLARPIETDVPVIKNCIIFDSCTVYEGRGFNMNDEICVKQWKKNIYQNMETSLEHYNAIVVTLHVFFHCARMYARFYQI